MSDQFLSQTELGRLHNVSSHKVGKWLMACGLRTSEKKPSPKAFQEGFVDTRPSTQPLTYYYVWNAEKTIQVLKEAGVGEPIITDNVVATNG